MKKITLVFATMLIALCLLSSCHQHRHQRNNLSLSVSDSETSYRLKAIYDEDNTGKVQRYINRQLKPNGLFASADDYFDVTTQLSDQTRFYIKASPGRLEIKINKQENSYASYTRVKSMCEGVVRILKTQ